MMRLWMLPTLIACAAGCSGRGLSSDALSLAVTRQKASLDECYEASLAREPDTSALDGRAILVIEPSGEVSSAVVEGEGIPVELAKCLHGAILGWKFPKASGKSRTSLPLAFRPEVVTVPGLKGNL